MYKLCKTEQSAARQHEIVHGLLSLMRKKRYEDITVSELCDGMSMPRKAFYRYFDSKDGALHALIDHTLHEYESFSVISTTPDGKRSLLVEIERYFLFWKHQRDFLIALDKSNLTGMLMQASLSDVVSDMINPDKFLPDDSRWMQARVLHFAISGLTSSMLTWFRGGFREDVRDMARAACRMLSRPLFPHLVDVGFAEELI